MASMSNDEKGYLAELSRMPGADAPPDFQRFLSTAEPVVYLCLVLGVGIVAAVLINRHRASISAALAKWLIAPVMRKTSRAGGRLKTWWLD